ncbi:MAG TPA: DUF1559 domain-containing protein [Gemmataceae bacterium]|nr:DUF1559 domain-containing protein [Gemmataceae bacterium]
MRWIVTSLVLLVVAVVLAGVLIPAIAHWRANADRVRCADNLRRIGKFLVDEAMQAKAFPAGTLRVAKLPPEERLSWIVPGRGLLGYPEQGPTIDLAAPWNAPENRKAAATFLPRLVCPSVSRVWSADIGAPTNYPGMAGVGADAAQKAVDTRGAGMFRHDEPTFLTDVKDGLANTLMLLETADQPGPWMAGGPPTVRPLIPANRPYLGLGRPFGGCHIGGANAGYADGPCRFLADSVSPEALELQAGIADTTHSADSQ